MSITESVLIFAGVPIAVTLIIAGLVYSGGTRYSGGTTRSKRYRPGRPYEFRPVWFLAAPDQLSAAGPALTARETRAALPPSASDAAEPGATGGASDRW